MIGEYVNAGTGRTVTISPAVPGARYRITAWALGRGNRSATPAVVYATTGEARARGIYIRQKCPLVLYAVQVGIADVMNCCHEQIEIIFYCYSYTT